MTTERTKWWKAFLPKKKSGGPKDATSTTVFGADFDPFAQPPERPKDLAAAPKNDQAAPQQEAPNNGSLLSDDTYDDSKLESVFNEQTCRRNMKVSRSGRYKEKRRVRSSLPLEDDMASGAKEDVR